MKMMEVSVVFLSFLGVIDLGVGLLVVTNESTHNRKSGIVRPR